MGTVIGDARAGAPELAARGPHEIGVRTIEFIQKDAPDIVGGPDSNGRFGRYDRKITAEIWYPAAAQDIPDSARAVYHDWIGRNDRNNLQPFAYPGRAYRDAEPDLRDKPWPVILISHGYPGSRFLLSNLAENLATKGYVVISPGHTDNTYQDFAINRSIESAWVHRSADQRLVLKELTKLAGEGWTKNLLRPDHVGLIGFSMGGYGALRTIGARIGGAAASQTAAVREYLSEEPPAPEVSAAVLFAPAVFWFGPESYQSITAPTLWACGTMDPMVYYALVRRAWESSRSSDRWLLTYEMLGHNIANNPAPPEALGMDWSIQHRWADPVWDTWRVNGINQHFVTAFFDAHLKSQSDKLHWLQGAADAGPAADDPGAAPGQRGPGWPGFLPETAVGLRMEHLSAG